MLIDILKQITEYSGSTIASSINRQHSIAILCNNAMRCATISIIFENILFYVGIMPRLATLRWMPNIRVTNFMKKAMSSISQTKSVKYYVGFYKNYEKRE